MRVEPKRCAPAAIFEAVHGTAPDIAGEGVANPTAILMSGIMMLEHMGESAALRRIEAALYHVYREGKLNPGLGGTAATQEFTEAVVGQLARN